MTIIDNENTFADVFRANTWKPRGWFISNPDLRSFGFTLFWVGLSCTTRKPTPPTPADFARRDDR